MTSLSIANAHIDCMHLPCRQGRLCLPFCSPYLIRESIAENKTRNVDENIRKSIYLRKIDVI